MQGFSDSQLLYVFNAVAFYCLLCIHFAMRRWRFEVALKYGWIVYALSLLAFVASVVQISWKAEWYLWIGGILYSVWAAFGYVVEYQRKIEWRNPIRWKIFLPFITLYLSTSMFYWWPMARVSKSIWFFITVLFVLNTYLNAISHHTEVSKSS